MASLWGILRASMRPYWLAQRGRCPLCGQSLGLNVGLHYHDGDRVTWEHVHPKQTHAHRPHNKVLAHRACNGAKGARQPRPCEVLYCEFVAAMVADIGAAGL